MRKLFMISLMAFGTPQMADAKTSRSGEIGAEMGTHERGERGQQFQGQQGQQGQQGMQKQRKARGAKDKGAESNKNRRTRGPQEPSWLEEQTPRRRGLRLRAPQVEQKPMSPRLMRQLKAAKRDQLGQKSGQGQRQSSNTKENNRQRTGVKQNGQGQQGQQGMGQKRKGAERQGKGRGQQ
jgi:hypothetical protein